MIVFGTLRYNQIFKFNFKHEYNLEEFYNKGIHSFNDWALSIERWVEKPSPDYLNFVCIWVLFLEHPDQSLHSGINLCSWRLDKWWKLLSIQLNRIVMTMSYLRYVLMFLNLCVNPRLLIFLKGAKLP